MMKRILCGSRIPRYMKCEQCGMNIAYVRQKGQTQIVCPDCKAIIKLSNHKY